MVIIALIVAFGDARFLVEVRLGSFQRISWKYIVALPLCCPRWIEWIE
jgi:hypothetical protein